MGGFGQALQGAGGGAMAGGAFGGVPGAIIGGALGGLGGLFGSDGSDEFTQRLKDLAEGYGKRRAPQGQAQYGATSGFRQNQAGLIAQLEAMARGEGPSAASMQMRDAMDRAAGAQASAAAGAGGRGVNAGAALRNATNNTAAIQAQGARDTATLRAQEQMGAIGQLGQTIGQGRAADENLGMFNAHEGNTMTEANMQSVLQQLGLNDKAQLQALLQAMGAAGPGTGTQLLAGGAQAVPGLLQYGQQKDMQQQYMDFLNKSHGF